MDASLRIAIVVAEDTYGLEILRGVGRFSLERPEWEFARSSLIPLLPLIDLQEWQGDGVIGMFYDAAGVELAKRSAGAVVNVSHRCSGLGVPQVGPDDRTIGRLGAEHLLARGFTNLAFCGIPAHWYSDERQAGFVARVHEAGRTCWTMGAELPAGSGVTVFEQLATWLNGLPRPLGLMACNDIRGRHVINECQRLGLRVPEDIAVLGVDNDEWQALMARVPLSSVDPDAQGVGFAAARLLDRLLSGIELRPGEENLVIPPKGVLARKSTDIIAAEDPVVTAAATYIREHSDHPLTVEEVLQVTDVSRRLLEMRFRRFLGRTPQQAIWKAHVDRAKALLQRGSTSMKEISRRSGFRSQEWMSVVFRRETGLTPSEYRERFGTP